MKLKELIDTIFFYLSVPKCISCGERLKRKELALCESCLKEYNEHKMKNCSLCASSYSVCTCTMKYLDAHYIHKMIKVYRYINQSDAPSNKLLFSLKRENRDDVIRFLSSELSYSIKSALKEPDKYIIINVPRSKKNIAKYGTDHSSALAKRVSKLLSCEYYQPLKSKNKIDQKRLSGEARLRNTNYIIKRNAKDLNGKRIILIDDIVTTGASISACAMLIKSLGAKEIIGASVAIAYKDNYKAFSKNDRFFNEGKGI